MEDLRLLRPALRHSLSSAATWFHSMTDRATQRLHYSYSVAAARFEDRPCPIRDIGTAADLATLSAAMRTGDYDGVIWSTLDHYQRILVHRPGPPEPWAYLAGGRGCLGEPSSVAHSAMLLLALAVWEGHPSEEARRSVMADLAMGIMRQQRADGTLQIYFEPGMVQDAGWQLYGGEAAVALAQAYPRLCDPRLLRATAAMLHAYQGKYRNGEVDSGERVFFANWECVAGAALHRHSTDEGEKSWVAAYLNQLQDDIIQSHFYEDVEQAPHKQAVVEVACALEGLAHRLEVSVAQAAASLTDAATAGAKGRDAAADEEQQRLDKYASCARIAASFLLEAQVRAGPGVPPAAVGGFPHTLRPGAGQRVDVTGHVCCAFVKLLEVMDSGGVGAAAE